MLRTYKTYNLIVGFLKFEFYSKLLGSVTLLRVTLDVTKTQPYIYIYIYRERERERERERWVQVTPNVILKSYTFFKSLDLSRFYGKKKTLINVYILIRISFNISYL